MRRDDRGGAIAGGTSVIQDTVYLDRFTHVPELARMGASIELKGNVAVVKASKGFPARK
jgi:UDP-N-acetylglucosamine 1-carboxyvinyltransferase